MENVGNGRSSERKDAGSAGNMLGTAERGEGLDEGLEMKNTMSEGDEFFVEGEWLLTDVVELKGQLGLRRVCRGKDERDVRLV